MHWKTSIDHNKDVSKKHQQKNKETMQAMSTNVAQQGDNAIYEPRKNIRL
jgi:hypothetical protein